MIYNYIMGKLPKNNFEQNKSTEEYMSYIKQNIIYDTQKQIKPIYTLKRQVVSWGKEGERLVSCV